MPTFVDDDSSISNKMTVSAVVILCVNVWRHNFCTHCAYGKMQVSVCHRGQYWVLSAHNVATDGVFSGRHALSKVATVTSSVMV